MLMEKDREILRAVINAYVEDVSPVSSQRVHDGGCQHMSTATIRNRMVVLEQEGYISKAHISRAAFPPTRVIALRTAERFRAAPGRACRRRARGAPY
jgi:heat-inducible transcriptional repressor